MRAAILIVSLVMGACAGVPQRLEPVDVTLSNIAPGEIGLLEQEYQVRLRVQNPNDVDIPIDGFAFQIDLNDKPFAKGVSNQRLTVTRFGEAMLQAKAVGTLSAMIGQILALQRNAPDKLRYRLKGRFGAHEGRVTSFDQTGEIDLPALSDNGR